MNRSCCKEAWSGLVDDKQKSMQQLPPALGYLFFYHLPLIEATGLSTLMARPSSQDHKPRFEGGGWAGGEHNMLLAVGGGGNIEVGLRYVNLDC